MLCTLLPAGSNPTPTTQPTKYARSRKGAGVSCCALSSATVKVNEMGVGAPLVRTGLRTGGVGRRQRLRLLFVNLLFVAVATNLCAMVALIVVLALIALFTLGDQ